MFAPNSMVNVGELAKLNDTLRKAGIGYQTPAGTSGGANGDLSPLVPQSIENTLSSATFDLKTLAIWPYMPKVMAGQTVHEYVRIEEHGLDLDPFLAEGGRGTTNKAEYSRESVKIKFLAERREVTDVATMVGLLGPNRQALAEETERGTASLLQKTERAIWHASESVNPIAFDGIITQIEANAPNNVTDRRGKGVTPELLAEVLGNLYAAPRYGDVDTIFVEPRVHQDLINYAIQFQRINATGAAAVLQVYGRDLAILGPTGPVPVKAAPFLWRSWDVPSTSSGGTGAPATPAGGNLAAAPSVNSLFEAADAGDYFYQLVAVTSGDTGGYSAPYIVAGAAVTVAAGDNVTLECTHDAAVTYYRVYRTKKDAAAATAQLIAEVANNTNGVTVAGGFQFVDENENLPGTSHVVFLKKDPRILEFARLLDLIRRPVSDEGSTVKPFLLMLFGSPVVKVPTKVWMLKNVGSGTIITP